MRSNVNHIRVIMEKKEKESILIGKGSSVVKDLTYYVKSRK